MDFPSVLAYFDSFDLDSCRAVGCLSLGVWDRGCLLDGVYAARSRLRSLVLRSCLSDLFGSPSICRLVRCLELICVLLASFYCSSAPSFEEQVSAIVGCTCISVSCCCCSFCLVREGWRRPVPHTFFQRQLQAEQSWSSVLYDRAKFFQDHLASLNATNIQPHSGSNDNGSPSTECTNGLTPIMDVVADHVPSLM